MIKYKMFAHRKSTVVVVVSYCFYDDDELESAAPLGFTELQSEFKLIV